MNGKRYSEKEDDVSQSSQVVAAMDTFTASDYLVRCHTSYFGLFSANNHLIPNEKREDENIASAFLQVL